MVNELDKLRWELHKKKYDILFSYGVKHGLIGAYGDRLLENLRHIYCGGIPASILLLHGKLSNSYCHDIGKLITLGFEDDEFQVINADIDSIRLKRNYVEQYKDGKLDGHYANHCFAERKGENGKTWVYDTSLGLIFEKSLYYKMENPKITKINDRETTLRFLYYDFQQDSDIQKDKYVLPLILPSIESNLIPTQPFYLEELKKEIEILKRELKYDEICKEFDDDMNTKLFKSDLIVKMT